MEFQAKTGQDLNHNTVIVYFIVDDLIRFSPSILTTFV